MLERTMSRDEARVREQLEARLKHRVNQRGWDYFVSIRWVEAVADGRLPLDSLVTSYCAWEDSALERAASSGRRTARSAKATRDERATALARIFATLADRDEDVQAFRRDVLGRDLVAWDAVPDWIHQRAASSGTVTDTVTIKLRGKLPPMPSDPPAVSAYMLAAAEAVTQGRARVVGVGEALTMLEYFDPGDPAARDGDGKLWPKNMPVAESSVLWSLHELARKLAEQFDCCLLYTSPSPRDRS